VSALETVLAFEHVSKDYPAPPPMRIRRLFARLGGLHVEDGFGPEVLGDDELDDEDDLDAPIEDVVPEARTGGDRRVIDDLTLDLHAGTIVALGGGEGSGKTTLLKLASGILLPSAGRVTTRGLVAPALISMSLVMPSRGHTVKVALPALGAMIGLSPAAVRDRLQDIAELVGNPRVLDSSTSLIETRVKRELILAMGVSLAPDVLLLDMVPPRTAFGERCVERIQALRAAGSLVVAEVRDARQLRKLGLAPDRIIVLGDGRVLSDGAPEVSGAA
jgi:ABC-type polysaccharide/polyol phosphate transport system ATPase subunit